MSIYSIDGEKLTPIKQTKFENEREIQRITENNLEELFNLKFVATEFQVDNLRIDTLAFNEETKSFVIIEYKNVKNYSVIDQGYSYLSLLLNNKAEFVLKYNLVYNTKLSKEDIDFSQTNVMFISPTYTTYQLRSVEFSDIAFELWKVVKYSNGTILYDKVNNTQTQASIKQITKENTKKDKVNKEIKKYTEEDTLMNKTDEIKSLYDSLKELILSKYDDIEINHWKYYVAIKTNNKIIATVSLYKKSLKAYINLKESEIKDPEDKVRNVSNIGHLGVGDYEYIIESEDDLYYFNKLFEQSYDEKI
jgi:predicted transport protein